jgi:hypothetical protein
MAEVIEDFTDYVRTGSRAKYPWKEWADGQARLLVRGVDYTVSDGTMRTAVGSYARRHNLKHRTSACAEGLRIIFPRPETKTVGKRLKKKGVKKSK